MIELVKNWKLLTNTNEDYIYLGDTNLKSFDVISVSLHRMVSVSRLILAA